MRIIAGSAKKRLLKVPPGWKGRPTADRVKESLFNILGNHIIDSIFLDLFAGTGNIGIEALSRGALRAVFVEKDPRAARTIIQNLKISGLYGDSRVMARDVYRALTELGSQKETKEKFDVIFLDPPYGMGFEVPVISRVLELGLLSPGGLIIAESSKRVELPSGIMGYPLVRKERYGDTVISFYQQAE
ncbi:MAG: 16S rRNA (guanine(966)-N(2))-methyltransferase RsmD [Bacillota bacterium]